MAEESGATEFTILAENLPPAWTRKCEFIPIALASSPATTIVKVSVLPTHMKDALAAASHAAETNDLRWAAMARGLGIIYSQSCRANTATKTPARSERHHRNPGSLRQTRSPRHNPLGPAEWKPTLQIWGPRRPDFPQMQKVKSVFDPQNILSPGRFAPNL